MAQYGDLVFEDQAYVFWTHYGDMESYSATEMTMTQVRVRLQKINVDFDRFRDTNHNAPFDIRAKIDS